MKKCWRCAEEIQDEAIACRFCNADQVGPPPIKPPEPRRTDDPRDPPPASKGSNMMAGVIVLGVILLGGAMQCSEYDSRTPEQVTADRAKQAEKQKVVDAEHRRTGMHCLAGSEGSHRALVNSVVASLRDPDSFDHTETRITPVDAQGNHRLFMRYRARNGFGGMNLAMLEARISNANCGFTIVTTIDQ